MHAALRGNAAASFTMHETTLADGGASRFGIDDPRQPRSQTCALTQPTRSSRTSSRFVSLKISCLAPA